MRFQFLPGLWLLLTLVPIIILFILRLRRRSLVIPSVKIWDRVLKRRPQSALWRRLKQVISLLLHLAVACLLALALARPFLSDRLAPQRIVVVIDASASMNARLPGGDADRTRFIHALDLARTIVDDIGPEDRAMIVRAGPRPSVVAPMTDHRASLVSALENLSASEAEGDLGAALTLALAACRTETTLLSLESERGSAATPDGETPAMEFEVFVLSDGGGMKTPQKAGRSPAATASPSLDEEIPEHTRIFYIPLGEAEEPNLAITAFRARRLPASANDATRLSADFEVLVRLRNFGPDPARAQVELHLDGELLDDLGEVDVPAGQEVSLPLRAMSLRAGGILELAMASEGDALPTDDVAFALIGRLEPTRVLLVQAMQDVFLRNALAHDGDLAVEAIAPEHYPPASSHWDVTIFEGWIPPQLPEGNVILVAPRGQANPFAISEEIEGPVVKDWDGDHPVLSYVVLEGAAFLSAQRIEVLPSAAWKVLADAWRGPLILASDEPGQRMVYFSFAFTDTDLVLRSSFPVLMSNAIQWAAERQHTGGHEQLRTGSVARFTLTAESETPEVSAFASVIRPDGSVDTLPRHGEAFLYPDTERLGVYVAVAGSPPILEQWEDSAPAAPTASGSRPSRRPGGPGGSMGFLRSLSEQNLAEAGTSQSPSRHLLATNLLSAQESDLGTRPTLGVGETVLEHPKPRFHQELRLELLWAALALLALEWLLYTIGVF